MEILGNFGFEPILLVAQIVNFFILFVLLKKFLYKPLLKVLNERKEKIAQGLKDAEDAARELENATKREAEILQKAQTQAKILISEAQALQTKMMSEAETRTQKQVDKMLKEAREQIVFETTEAEKRLSSKVSQLAVQFLQTTIKDILGTQEQEIIMRTAMKKLKEKRAD